MAPRPGTDQTASSAKRPRSASPSFRANASKILRTIASFSGAATTGLPARDEAVDMPTLRLGEGSECDESASLCGIVVLDRGLEMLALRRRLLRLTAEPAEEAHGGLVRHAAQATAVRSQSSVVSSAASSGRSPSPGSPTASGSSSDRL